jgi:hypothetical protein
VGKVVYWIDGVQVATHAVTYSGKGAAMKPAITDLTLGDGALSVNWMRMSPYAATGAYTSRIFDANQSVTWATIVAAGDRPLGTNVVLEVRTGQQPTLSDGVWMPATLGAIGRSGRYAQYRLTLTTSVTGSTPDVKSVLVTYAQ